MTAPPAQIRRLELPLDGSRSWRRRTATGRLLLSTLGLLIEHEERLREPLHLSLGALAVASVDPGSARPSGAEGRFPVLKRLGSGTVVPRTDGLEGWLWTTTGGSALPALCQEDEAPNLALLLAQPLGEEAVVRAFREEVVREIAARSPLGAPSVAGLLLRVADAGEAERALSRLGLHGPVTDREVPPPLRRSLPGDRSADIALPGAAGPVAGSVAPPGVV